MRICIIGGTGNISTSITNLLRAQGHQVTLANRGRTVPPQGPPKGVRVIEVDRQQRGEFESRMRQEKFDAAIDMICFTRDDAESTLRAFRGVKHLVHTSTVCTYGVDYDWLPATEDHPLRPISEYGRNKVAADNILLEAFYREGYPVTIIKPSTTYGPTMGLLRQVAWEFGWIDRVRKGKPIVVSGDGKAMHQFLYADDAALAFAGVLGKDRCIGQVYNMTGAGYTTWIDYHSTAMKVIGRQVEMVGVPLEDILATNVPNSGICRDIFAHNVIYSPAKLMRDVPEFQPRVSLEEGMSRVLEAMDRRECVPDSDKETWEDNLIAAQRKVRETKL